MLLKNVSFELLTAVKENTKDFIVFQPQQEIEVSEEDGNWFLDRYSKSNAGKDYFRVIPQVVPENVLETIVEPNTLENTANLLPETKEFRCETCGRLSTSLAGLKAHQRSHK